MAPRQDIIDGPGFVIEGDQRRALTVFAATRQWVAKLRGVHPEYRFERKFLREGRDHQRRVKKFYFCGSGVYEYRGFGTNGRYSGFFRLHDDLTVEQIDSNEAVCAFVDVVTRMGMLDAEFLGPPPPSGV